MKFWWQRFISDKNALRSAAAEVLLVSLLSLLPLLLLALIDVIRLDGDSAQNRFYSALASGQLYLYSFAMFGTLFWLCQKDYESFAKFPLRKWFMLAIILPMFLIMVVYFYDPSLRRPLHSNLVYSSVIVYLLYVSIYFVLTVFDNLRAPAVQEELKEGTEKLLDGYSKIERQ
jgi:hypothetical protein